jgi:hypothetical protein
MSYIKQFLGSGQVKEIFKLCPRCGQHKTRYYQVFYTMARHYEHIEADWFDTFTEDQQKYILKCLDNIVSIY